MKKIINLFIIFNYYKKFKKMSLGRTFQEKYENFFKFFGDSSRTINEINKFINDNKIPIYSQMNRINLNMIDSQNLNILFHIIRKSVSDNDCLEKLKLLIEIYHVNYNLFDISRHRTLPFYTCVKGYLESTKYLIDKMKYNINSIDSKEETLFFSAIRSFNVELVKYLDEKYKNWIYFPNNKYNSCIFNIFKNSIRKEGEEKIKNLLRFIINKGFDIYQKNNENVSFKELCSIYNINNYLTDVLKEFKNKKENEQKILNDNDINDNKINFPNINLNNRKEDSLYLELNDNKYKNSLTYSSRNESIIGKNQNNFIEEKNLMEVDSDKSSQNSLSDIVIINKCSLNEKNKDNKDNFDDLNNELSNKDYNKDNNEKNKLKCCVFCDSKNNFVSYLSKEKINKNKKLIKNYLERIKNIH